MFKYLSIFLILITGCSTKVHLFTQGYHQQQVNELKRQLQDKGFVVAHAKNHIPRQFPNSVIAVNPKFNQSDTISQLQKILDIAQYPIATVLRFGQGNHFYSTDHVGLYLRHPNFKPVATIPPYIVSRRCHTTLALNSNGEFTLEIESFEQQKYRLNYQQGRWQYDGEVLRLSLADGEQYSYHRQREQRATYQGLKPADIFRPLNNISNQYYDCVYEVIYLD